MWDLRAFFMSAWEPYCVLIVLLTMSMNLVVYLFLFFLIPWRKRRTGVTIHNQPVRQNRAIWQAWVNRGWAVFAMCEWVNSKQTAAWSMLGVNLGAAEFYNLISQDFTWDSEPKAVLWWSILLSFMLIHLCFIFLTSK